MSSYLNIYLVPKVSDKIETFENGENVVKEIKLSEGKPIHFLSYCRSSNIYQAFNEALNVTYIGTEDEPKYEELTCSKIDMVISDLNESIDKIRSGLTVNYKMLNNGAKVEELWEDIHDAEDYLKEELQTLEEIKHIRFWVLECEEGYNNFEKVLMNID